MKFKSVRTEDVRDDRSTGKRMFLIRYLASLNSGRFILWCYLIWYLVVLVRYFDPAPALWLTSMGLSFIIGFALYISTTASPGSPKLSFWPKFRLFVMPFCVSSFAALVKGKGFILVFSPRWQDSAIAVAMIVLFSALVWVAKAIGKKRTGKAG